MAETGSVKVTIDEETITRRIRDRLAEVWDEGYNQATFEFVDSDYCGREHQCQGIIGTRNDEKNPYRS